MTFYMLFAIHLTNFPEIFSLLRFVPDYSALKANFLDYNDSDLCLGEAR